MPTLYYSPGACSLAVHIVLEWIGQPYEIIKVDIHHPDPSYTRINSAGAVPRSTTAALMRSRSVPPS